MTYDQIDARKKYVQQVRASFQDPEEDWTHPAPEQNEPALGKTFTLRLVLGLLLFLLFVLADVTGHTIFQFTASDIAEEIAADDYTNLEKYVMMLFADKNEL